MPARLVYSPKVYCYTKNNNGTILDLSPFVVSGNVNRLINQVSTATVTLRNPMKRFTTPANGAPFHPQDPITIYLERIPGFPVRVFTGYLDETPYYQLYPGVISLQASCTLKRLLYSWFDPSLPYMISFFEQYGWINTGQGSIISTTSFNSQKTGASITDVIQGKAAFDQLNDGSLGKLLWAVLYNIAQWQDGNIWIEPLPNGPNGIAARMAQLMKTIDSENALAANQLSGFLSQIIGTGSAGSGGGMSNNGNIVLGNGKITSAKGLTIKGAPIGSAQLANLNTCLSIASGAGASQLVMQAMVFAGIAETGWDNNAGAGGKYQTVFQSDFYRTDQLDQATQSWLKGGNSFGTGGGIGYVKDHPNATLQEIASYVEGSGNQYLSESGYSQFAPEAVAIVAAYDGGSSQTTPVSPTTGTTGSTTTAVPQGKSSAKQGSQMTVINAIIEAANAIDNQHYSYSWGGGHEHAGVPSVHSPNSDGSGTPVLGFDCSGSVAAVLSAANIIPPGSSVGADNTLVTELQARGVLGDGPGSGSQIVNLYDYPGQHIFMSINGVSWGTLGFNNTVNQASSGGGWTGKGSPPTSEGGAGLVVYHIRPNLLQNNTTYSLNLTGGGTTVPGGTSGAASDITGSAEAFTAQVNFPSIEDQVTALMLGQQHKGLMHDQQLLPFVQQLATSSMRSFQSLPNGDFYAFYPDYFGEMGQHDPYWLIDDIEILDGQIKLSDNALSTHVFAVGDNTWPVNEELLNELFSAGTISVFNAFLPTNILDTSEQQDNTYRGTSNIMSTQEASDFIKRYGARPLVLDYPMVRSPIYEMLLAYQQFMLAWSNQFLTPFTFTFMPELFPGGKVAFTNHGFQMYINEVTHTWDLEEGGGFTTTAQLSAPAVWKSSAKRNPDLPPLMVAAMVEPIRGQTGQIDSVKAPPPNATLGHQNLGGGISTIPSTKVQKGSTGTRKNSRPNRPNIAPHP